MIPANRFETAQLGIGSGLRDQRLERRLIVLRQNKTGTLRVLAMQGAAVQNADSVSLPGAEQDAADFDSSMPDAMNTINGFGADFV